MRVVAVVTVFAACTSLVGCGSTGIPVSAAEYGDRWPFTIPSGTLECQMSRSAQNGGRPLVLLSDGKGISYGINGAAKSFGFTPADEILRAAKNRGDTSDFVERGLALCPKE